MPPQTVALDELTDDRPSLVPRHDSSIFMEFSLSPCLTAFTISCPDRTCPKTVCLPFSQSVATWVMKNWLPFVFGPALAIDRDPTWCLCGLPLVSSSNL